MYKPAGKRETDEGEDARDGEEDQSSEDEGSLSKEHFKIQFVFYLVFVCEEYFISMTFSMYKIQEHDQLTLLLILLI